jgi:hypothetical protein
MIDGRISWTGHTKTLTILAAIDVFITLYLLEFSLGYRHHRSRSRSRTFLALHTTQPVEERGIVVRQHPSLAPFLSDVVVVTRDESSRESDEREDGSVSKAYDNRVKKVSIRCLGARADR